MELNDYQRKAMKTALFPKKYKIIYSSLGLGNEVGEVMGKIKKWLRGDDGRSMSVERRDALKDELGDVLWYLAVLSDDLNFKLDDIAKLNIEKLRSRRDRGVLKGDGDKR